MRIELDREASEETSNLIDKSKSTANHDWLLLLCTAVIT